MAIQGFFTGDVKIRDLNGVLKAVDGIVEVATDAGTVTSVGLTVGSTGTDVNVANSPITSSGNITLNLPTASATNRGLLSSTDWAIFSAKQGTITLTTTGNNGSATLTSGTLNIPTYTLAGLGGISLTSLSASSPLAYNNTTGAFSIQVANGSQNGYLSSSDWTTFNSKQSALTFSSPLVNTAGTVSIPAATSSVNGYLTSTDWVTFNAKQGAITLTTTGSSGAATLIGTTLNIPDYTPDLSGYVPTSRQLTINGTTYDLSANRSWSVGTVTSVGITMPSAFAVSSSPVTGSGTISVTGAGNATQYVRGDGQLATLPTNGGGGGASVSYYLNGSVNQGTIGGVTYYEMNKTPIIGAGTDFSRSTNGYIASFLTDANDPALLNIPAGNWNFETYFQASSGGGSPTFYIELYKYDGTTFTLIASNSATPKLINDGANIEAYFSALAVPQTTLTLTDRLAVRIYVTTAGRTITLHTENGHLCQVITTFTTGLTALNGLTSQVQYLATGTSGTDFNISSATDTHTFNLPTASATNRGALSSTDWTTFNSKQNALSGTGFVKISGTTISYDNSTYYLASNPSAFIALTSLSATAPLSYSNTTGVFSISQATTSTDGYLSSTDWNTFYNKQTAGSYITALTGEATASGPGSASVTLSTSAVTGKLLTGLNLAGGGTIAATDSILQAFGKVQNQISGMVGGVTFQGTWDASTNTPTLTSSVGTKGYYYIVSVAGSTNLNGITDWKIGDWAIFNGTTWDKVDNTDAVSSVNGFTGAVSLTTSNIAEGTNLYYLDSRARLALSFTAGSGAYNNTTGVITIPTNTSQLTNGANFISLSSLSASSPLAYNSGSGAFSIQVANGSQNGYLSSTDWTKFNNNIPAGTPATGDYIFYNGSNLAYRNFIATTPLSYNSSTATFSISQASGSANGFLSSSDWTTFNNKQSALTNPVTGTGTTNYLPKFTGTSTIGNSIIYEAFSGVVVGGPIYAADGTSTSASIRFLNANSGLYNAPSDALGFITSGTSKMILNASGNLGLGVTPSAWTDYKVLQFGGGSISSYTDDKYFEVNQNSFWNGSYKYVNTGFATRYMQYSGQHQWHIAPSGTAGNAISFTQAMTLNASGNLSIGNTNDTYKLDVSGTGRFSDGTQGLMIRAYTGTDGWGAIYPVGVTPNTSNYTLIAKSTSAVLNASTSVTLAVGDSGKLTANSTGISVTGAATFSSSVTATTASFSSSSGGADLEILKLANNGAGANTQAKIQFAAANTNYASISGGYGASSPQITYAVPNGNHIFTGNSVGIGTTSPNARLTVVANDSSNPNVALRLSSTAYSGVSYPNTSLRFGSDYPNYPTWNLASIDSSYTGGNWGGSLLFYTNNDSAIGNLTERMRITSGGQFIVGDTSMAYANSIGYVVGFKSAFTGQSIISIARAGQTLASQGMFIGLDTTTSYFWNRDNIAITFGTNDTEKMRITSGGTLLVGTTTEGFLGKLQVAGSVAITGQYNTVLPSSSFSYFDGSGQVVSSSSSASALYLDTTWNTTGNPDGIYLNVTNTASGASSKLLNLKVGSVSQFSVSKAGAIQTSAPTGGTARPWKLGTVYTGTCVPSDFGSFGSWFTGTVIEIEVNGTTYKIPAIIDNYC
jgi:hypothetical protein